LFSLIGLPHADDAPLLAALGPDNDDQSVLQVADADKPSFTVRETNVFGSEMMGIENVPRPRKVEASLDQSLFPFYRVIGYLHELLYVQ
jgi:hypothetical protein